MIEYANGDMFAGECNALINTVNCDGVMGGGLAAQMKLRYPGMYQTYRWTCAAQQLVTGMVLPYFITSNEVIINLPTKDRVADRSELTYVKEGLDALVEFADVWPKLVYAVPPLGCGLGGLNEDDVLPLIVEALKDHPARFVLYNFKEHGENQENRIS